MVSASDDIVGVARQVAQQVIGGGGGIDAYPVPRREVEGLADAVEIWPRLSDCNALPCKTSCR